MAGVSDAAQWDRALSRSGLILNGGNRLRTLADFEIATYMLLTV